MEGVRTLPAGEHTGRPNTMGLFHRQRKEYYLQAPNENEQKDWINKLVLSGRLRRDKGVRGSQSAQSVRQL